MKFSFLLMVFCLQEQRFYRTEIFCRRQCAAGNHPKAGKKEEHHGNIYVIDRGLQSVRVMKEFEEKSVKFIVRSKENRKFEEVESYLTSQGSERWNDWTVLKDSKVKLYRIQFQQILEQLHHPRRKEVK